MAARYDVQHALLIADLRHGQSKGRVHVAKQEVHLVALDQLACLLHRRSCIAARRIFDEKLHLPAEDASLGVDLVDRVLAAGQLVLAGRRIGAGKWIVQTDLDHFIRTRLHDKRRRQLQCAGRDGCLDDATAADLLCGFLSRHVRTPPMWILVSDGIDAINAGKLDAILPLATRKGAYNLPARAARPSLNGTRNSVFLSDAWPQLSGAGLHLSTKCACQPDNSNPRAPRTNSTIPMCWTK